MTQNYYNLFVVRIAILNCKKNLKNKIPQEDIILVMFVYLLILGHEAFPWGCSRPFSDLMGCVGCG